MTLPPRSIRSWSGKAGAPSPATRGRSQIIVPALLAALLLLIALILEISRSNSTLRTSLLTGDARNAVAAAEFGLQALLDELNTADNNYLLVTRLTNPRDTGDWQTVTSADLAGCGIKAPPAAPSPNRIAGVSTNGSETSVALPANVNASYSLIGYEPPASKGTPERGRDCTMFGNLQGGRARLTVRGTIQRNGTPKATYDLVREVDIRTEAQLAENNLGLVITGPPDKSKTGNPFHIIYDENRDGAIGTSGSAFTEPLGNVNCVLCESPSQLDTRGTSLDSVITGPIPNFPTFPELPPEIIRGIPAQNLDEDNFGVPIFYPANYPYNHPSSTSPSVGLVSGCRYLEVDGVPNAEIGCKLVNIKNFGTIRVRADVRPIKLFLSGAFDVSAGNQLQLTDGNAATPEAQDASKYWKNLWIYGRPGTPDANGSNCDQEVTINGSGDAFGARLWFPLGRARMGGGSFGKREFIGSLWTCIFNQGTDNATVMIPSNLVQTWKMGGGEGGFSYRALPVL